LKNNKIIVVSGFSRGGTNLLWNLLQSHPQITSARYETGTIFHKKTHPFSKIVNLLKKLQKIDHTVGHRVLDLIFFSYKLSNYWHPENRYKSESERYSFNEVKKTALCFKSVDLEINYTDTLKKMYPDLYFIGLTRNGYATAEGHQRRGNSVSDFAEIYSKVAAKMHSYQQSFENFKLVRFEDMTANPFDVANELYDFLDCNPRKLDKIRLKSKKILKSNGRHEENFGESGKKYWFDNKTVKTVVKSDINQDQINNLDKTKIYEFNQVAEKALKYFGYQILD